MSGNLTWVVMMWLMAGCSLMVGGIDAFDRLRTSPVEMILDPTISDVARKMLKAELDDENRIMMVISAPVVYTFKDGKKLWNVMQDYSLTSYEVYFLDKHFPSIEIVDNLTQYTARMNCPTLGAG